MTNYTYDDPPDRENREGVEVTVDGRPGVVVYDSHNGWVEVRFADATAPVVVWQERVDGWGSR